MLREQKNNGEIKITYNEISVQTKVEIIQIKILSKEIEKMILIIH